MRILGKTFQQSEMVLATTVGEELVMLDMDKDRYLSLNEAGHDIWEKLSQGLNGHEIARHISDDYGVELSQAEQDVENLLCDLLGRSMIVEAPPPAS